MNDKWEFIIALDDELLKGGLIENESICELIRNVDICFVNSAYLSAIATSAAVVEALLKADIPSASLKEAIDKSDFDIIFKSELHALRISRNTIMHNITEISEEEILDNYELFMEKQKEYAKNALVCMRKIFYRNQSS